MNLCLFVLLQISLYALSKEILKDGKKALIPVALYGLSAGAASNVIFIRMYTLLALICTLFMYVNVRLLRNPKSAPNYLFLSLITILGALSHYYFYVFGFFVSAIFCFVHLFKKKWSVLCRYVLTMAASIAASVLIFPSVIDHVFKGQRGIEAFENLFESSLFQQLTGYLSLLHQQTGLGWMLLIAAVLIMLFFLRNMFISKFHLKMNQIAFSAWIICAVFFYLAVVSKIAPYMTDRYIFCIYPCAVLALCILIFSLSEPFRNKALHLLLICALFLTVLSTFPKGISYTYEEDEKYQSYFQEHANASTIVLTENNWKIHASLPYIIKTSQYIVTKAELDENITAALLECNSQELFLFISNDYEDFDAIAEMIQALFGYSHAEYLYKKHYFEIYRLY